MSQITITTSNGVTSARVSSSTIFQDLLSPVLNATSSDTTIVGGVAKFMPLAYIVAAIAGTSWFITGRLVPQRRIDRNRSASVRGRVLSSASADAPNKDLTGETM